MRENPPPVRASHLPTPHRATPGSLLPTAPRRHREKGLGGGGDGDGGGGQEEEEKEEEETPPPRPAARPPPGAGPALTEAVLSRPGPAASPPHGNLPAAPAGHCSLRPSFLLPLRACAVRSPASRPPHPPFKAGGFRGSAALAWVGTNGEGAVPGRAVR